MKRLLACFLLLGLPFLLLTTKASACPFCSAATQTFTEEITSMDAVVIATLIESPPKAKSALAAEFAEDVAKSKFKVTSVIKGTDLVKPGDIIETLYFGEAKKDRSFLVMAVDPQNLMWSTPLILTKRAESYVSKLLKVPQKGTGKLRFFQDYLEDKDEMLARDAYDEFAKAPYDEVKALKPYMKHDQLVEWIKDRDIPASRRRLYLTLLGVCGSDADLPLLEKMLRSQDRREKAGLDAMIACYLTLRGAEGMPLIEDLFLRNAKAEYADTYAAIMAIRFHGNENDIIPKKRLLVGLRYMLERPQLADLVIPDLASWQDWSQVDRLVTLFKEADEKTSWVRVPVVNYLRACPHPEAKTRIAELEKVDPEAVKRARTFFPFNTSKDKEADGKEDTAGASEATAEK